MKKLWLSVPLAALLAPSRADAFIFTDLVAKAQRIIMISHAGEYIEQINTYRKEFDKYKKEFEKYFQSFRRIYRRLSAADWRDFTPANWNRLDDHLTRRTSEQPTTEPQTEAEGGKR